MILDIKIKIIEISKEFSLILNITLDYEGYSVTSIGNSAFNYCTSLIIYCEASSKPSDWDKWWNYSNRPVVWGYKEN